MKTHCILILKGLKILCNMYILVGVVERGDNGWEQGDNRREQVDKRLGAVR